MLVATAGHVDHGKSTLVLALTGTDPDRLDEEKRRGLTIDLGFASTTLPSGRELSVVDVPGHARFLPNMLAGVGAVDCCLLVVDAAEGWKPQSEEHLRIVELLGVPGMVVALTKAGKVSDVDLHDAALDVRAHLAGSRYPRAEIVRVDSIDGTGLSALRAALDDLAAHDDPPQGSPRVEDDPARARLWIDRAFSLHGTGTVVTGTLLGGSLEVGGVLELWPERTPVRVRALHHHNSGVARVAPGTRAGVNLSGVAPSDLTRGSVLVRPGVWHPTRVLDASLGVLASSEGGVGRRGAHLGYIGTSEQAVALRVLAGTTIEAGRSGNVRMRLPGALPLLPGDRYVLRDAGRSTTLGGGEILDVDPVLPVSRAAPDRDPHRVVRERGWVRTDELERLTGHLLEPSVGPWVVDPGELRGALDSLAGRIEAAGPRGVALAELDDRTRELLGTLADVTVDHGRARTARSGPPHNDHPWLRAAVAEPFRPPEPGAEDRGALAELSLAGLATRCGKIWFATQAVERAARDVAGWLSTRPEGFTVGEAGALWGTSRKYTVPLLEHLDAIGCTRRRGDRRTAGPRLPGVGPD